MAIFIGPGGNSESFKERKLSFPKDIVSYLKEFNLNAYEIECGRGINIAEQTYRLLPDIIRENKIVISVHSPFFVSLSSTDEEVRTRSVDYILKTAEAAKKLGSDRIIVHSGSCAKIAREEALELARDTLSRAREKLDKHNLENIIICPETMGKINQLGTLSEVLSLCKADKRYIPCVDFGHLNARTFGGIKTIDDYRAIFDEIEQTLGLERTTNIHIHFSKIEYTKGGEKKHLTFSNTNYGPDYAPLLDVIKERNYNPVIICESQGTQAEDAAIMNQYYLDI